MFEKLLSLLPYNPGLAGQMAFYSQRMRQEASIRRIGMMFIVLAFMVQFFAVLVPPQSTLAADVDNDLITHTQPLTATSVANACQTDARGYQRIMHYYGIHCDTIAAAPTVDISSSARDNQYYSMGHDPIDGADVDSVGIDGAGTLHIRHLSTFKPDSWSALQVTNDSGDTLYILLWCGNLVTVGRPHHSTFIPRGSDTLTVTGTYTNADNGNGGGDTSFHSTDTNQTTTNQTTTSDTAVIPAETPQTGIPTATAHQICKFDYRIFQDDAACPAECPWNTSIPITDEANCHETCPYNGAVFIEDDACKPCEKSVNAEDTVSCIDIHKSAANVTAGIADANNTTAKGGDVITYTLYAHNNGKATVQDFTFQEDMNDVLDYADINDFHGAILDSHNLLTWPSKDIPSDATITAQITVKIKDPVPQTPVNGSSPTRFNLVMTNIYGNTVNIMLPGSPAKTIQAAATSLPNTGPGTSLFVAASIVLLAGYFYGRARLLAKESMIAVKENAGA